MTALALSDLNTSISADPRIEDLRIAKALGYAVPRMIRKLIARHIKPLQRFGEVCSTVEQTGERGGRPAKAYWLNKKQALYICTKSETEKATEATIEMVEVFDAYMSGRLDQSPAIPVRAHTRRRSKEGEGSFIVADDGLFPFVSRGDEVFVSFCTSAQMPMHEPAALFVLLHPVDGRPEVHHIYRQNAGAFKAPDPNIMLSLGRIGGSRALAARHWRVLGRVIAVNKADQRRIEPAKEKLNGPRWPSHPHVWERQLPPDAIPNIDNAKRTETLPDGSIALPIIGGGYTILPPDRSRKVA